MPLDQLARAWPLGEPYRLRPTAAGISRQSRFVDAPSGSYVLSVYPDHVDAARVRYEHALLAALAAADLPFAVPSPLPAHTGESWIELPETGRLAALFPVLAGGPPDREDPAHVRALGRALGHLHLTMARLDVPPPPPAGPFAQMEPLLAEPDRLLAEELPAVGPEESARARANLAALAAALPKLLAGLPRQLCHGDYNAGNTLFVGDRVSAVLDFEAAGPHVRALDLGLGWYYACPRPPAEPWDRVAAFGRGYRDVLAISEKELAAAAVLPRWYFGAALIFVAERVRRGLEDEERFRERARRLRHLDDLVATHRDRIAATLAGA